jgi:HK97 family phage major capsid protein
MPTIRELREEQARVITEARSLNDTITEATTEADAKNIEMQVDRALERAKELDAKIERAEAIEKAEARAKTEADPRRPDGAGEARGQDQGNQPSYREAFAAFMRAGGAVSEISAEHRAILQKGHDAEFRVQGSATGAAGGFTVPTELQAGLIKSMALWGPMYDEDVAFTLNTASGNPLTFTGVDDRTVAVVQHTQGSQLADDNSQDAVFTQLTLNAHAYNTEWVQVSLELMQDSIENMEAVIINLLGERLGRRVNTELTTGDGTGDPQGIVTGSTLGRTAAAAAAITGDEIIDLLHSVDPAYRNSPKAAFMFNDLTLAAIRKLKDGQGNYLWQMGDVRTAQPGTLLGYRYYVNQAMANIATAQRSIIFGDFSKYYVRKVGGPVIGVARERFWPQVGIGGLVRLDGRLMDTRAVRHLVQA